MKFFLFALLLALSSVTVKAESNPEYSKDDQILRQARGTYDLQHNSVSNLNFCTSNNGITFYNSINRIGNGLWPRGSSNLYIFGDGFWFGTKRINHTTGQMQKYITLSYDPQKASSWMVPGCIADGDTAFPQLANKYRIYFSSDFLVQTGEALNSSDGPNWPLWNIKNKVINKYGSYESEYIDDINNRKFNNYPLGPAFVSNEDIHCVYKDTDLRRYEGGETARKAQGYPLGLECKQTIYSWGYGELKDVIVIFYEIANRSTDTLMDCYFAKISDTDIGLISNMPNGAGNDRVRYFNEDGSLNLAVAWTDSTRGEAGKDFGYLGLTMLESPSVDANGFIRTDKLIYPPSEQLGLYAYRNWSIDDDPRQDEARYNFISAKMLEGDTGPGDKRMLLSAGPFNMRPGDKTRIAVSYSFALPAKGGEADGTLEDIAGFKKSVSGPGEETSSTEGSLLSKVEKIKKLYYVKYYNSINDNDLTTSNKGIELSPNPAVNFIEITEDDISFADNKMQIYSITGKLISEMPYSKRIDISGLSAGVYFLTIGSRTELFIKN